MRYGQATPELSPLVQGSNVLATYVLNFGCMQYVDFQNYLNVTNIKF